MKLDPKVIFYLTNKDQIDEWYNLSVRAADAAHKFFCDIAPDVEDLSIKLDGNPIMGTDFEDPWPGIYLYQKNWFDKTLDYPFIAIMFYWNRKNASFTNTWCGVWINQEMKDYEKFKPILFEAIKKTAPKNKFIERYTGEWAIYRNEKPKAKLYWDNLDDYKTQILSSLEENCNLFWSAMDKAWQQFEGMK